MWNNTNHRYTGALFATVIAFSTTGMATAAPMSVAGPAVVSPAPQIEQARYRVHYRRHYFRPRYRRHYHHRRYGVGPGAVFGLFGSAIAAAIANSSYDDGSYYAPGPNYYGGPAYSYGYGFRGGRGFRGGGFGGHPGFGGHAHFAGGGQVRGAHHH